MNKSASIHIVSRYIPIDDLSRRVRAMVDDLPGDLVANNAGASEREFTFDDMEIRVADSTGCIKWREPMSDQNLRGSIHGAALSS